MVTDLTLKIASRTIVGANFENKEVMFEYIGEQAQVKKQEIKSAPLAMGLLVRQAVDFMVLPLSLLFPRLRHSKLSLDNRTILRNMRRIKARVKEIIDERRSHINNEHKNEDVLSFLLKEENNFTEEYIIDETLAFIFAGHESSARAITSFIYNIAKSTRVLEKLRAELRRVLFNGADIKDGNRISELLTEGRIQDLEYMIYCMKESMRIDCPASFMSYSTKADTTLGKYKIKKGTNIDSDTIVLLNNEKNWIRPSEFIPERFEVDSPLWKRPDGGKRHPSSYLPFSAGARNCIGQNFALWEIKYYLVYILSMFDFELPKELQDREERLSFTLGSTTRLPLKLLRR